MRLTNWLADKLYFPGWTVHPYLLFALLVALLVALVVGAGLLIWWVL